MKFKPDIYDDLYKIRNIKEEWNNLNNVFNKISNESLNNNINKIDNYSYEKMDFERWGYLINKWEIWILISNNFHEI